MERNDTMMRAARYLLGAGTMAAAMMATTAGSASAQTTCPDPGQEDGMNVSICGRVFDDANSDKIHNPGEPYIGGPEATVVADSTTTTDTFVAYTSPCDPMYPEKCGYFAFPNLPVGTYEICVINMGEPETCDGAYETETVTTTAASGVTEPGKGQDVGRPGEIGQDDGPGTGTPGYWKNHPEAWPVDVIKIGGIDYAKDAAIKLMGKVGGDKSITIFSSLLSAKLNVLIGNPTTCVATAISDGDAWFATYQPAGIPGTKITGSSPAWSGVGHGGETHQVLDNYNNGLLGPGCGHHRN